MLIAKMDNTMSLVKLFITPFLIIFGLGILGLPKIYLYVLLGIFIIIVNVKLRKMYSQ